MNNALRLSFSLVVKFDPVIKHSYAYNKGYLANTLKHTIFSKFKSNSYNKIDPFSIPKINFLLQGVKHIADISHSNFLSSIVFLELKL